MRRFSFMLAASALLLLASSASAAIVNFQLLLDVGGPGTYELRASASQGDNFGIASYSAQLTDVLTIEHVAPQDGFVGSANGTGPAGFTVLRTADNDAGGIVFASQDTIAPTPNLVYNFGQAADSFTNLGMTDFTGGSQVDQPVWDANLLLATGTYEKGVQDPGFRPGSVELFSNVFTSSDGAGVQGSQITTEVIPIPEPGTLVLAGLSLIGVFVSRRRLT